MDKKVSMNDLASKAFNNALKREKTSIFNTHEQDMESILNELLGFKSADENKKSEHLPNYTEAQEELADILICCFTELFKRGVNVDEIIAQKIAFNESRTKL